MQTRSAISAAVERRRKASAPEAQLLSLHWTGLKFLLATALLGAGSATHAAITVYTAQPAFLAAVMAAGVDTFADFSTTGSTATPIARAAGSYTYTAEAVGDFFGAGSVANPWLSTNEATSAIVFSAFSAGASAVGGNFFGSSISGAFASGSVTLTATDSLGATSNQSIVGATTSSFVGFVSTGSLVSLSLAAVQPASGFLWPAADNLVIAVASPIPEPRTYALMLAGAGLAGLITRRRRRA